MAGYLRQDLNIRWHNPQDWVVYLSVHNLWDTRYLASGSSPSDLQQGARRRLTIGMTRSF
jgi:outer membrane receptor protein involved in Fe transport